MRKKFTDINGDALQMMEYASGRQLRQIRRDKTRHLGPIESLHLFRLGRKDGKQGLPKQEVDKWLSPLLIKEVHRYQEFCDRTWGAEQIYLEPAHLQSRKILTELALQEKRLAEVMERYVPSPDEFFSTRKKGEENLSLSQVQARRRREENRRLSAVKAEARSLEDEISKAYEQLAMLHSHIVESEDAARLICERVMNHSKQRIDAYWKASLPVHPDGSRMPAVPSALLETDAEETYMKRHADENEAVLLRLEQRKKQLQANEEDMNIKEVA